MLLMSSPDEPTIYYVAWQTYVVPDKPLLRHTFHDELLVAPRCYGAPRK